MKLSIQKEISSISIVLIPFIYLLYIWNKLPEKVPVQWSLDGEINRYGSKLELLLIPIALPVLTYTIFILAPYIDPKGKIKNMGSKYNQLKTLVILLMTLMSLFILYNSINQSTASPNYIIPILGVLFIVFGNYFKTIKANYFIGIRTPWTLENENVWKKTHTMAGKLWFIAGLIIVLGSVILEPQNNLKFALFITTLIVIIPLIYSYMVYKRGTTK